MRGHHGKRARVLAFALAMPLVGAVGFAGCGNRTARVEVHCRGVDDGVWCVTKHTEGDATGRACWDVVVTCKDSKSVSAEACATVSPGETMKQLVERAKFGECGVPTGIRVENLRVEAK